jgi:hypothetical protein
MDSRERAWLENRVRAAVEDDFYLDREEEKRLKEEAAARGIPVRDAALVVRGEIQKLGAVSERELLDRLDQLLHQFTDDDKLLDKKEERDAFDQVVLPAPGKKKGLDPRVAEERVESFCKVNGIRRSSSGRSWTMPVAAVAILALVLLAVILLRGPVAGISSGGGASASLSKEDTTEIDQHLERAGSYIERAQYTEPPERSAKAELDAIAILDPGGTYRGEETKALRHRIVQHYLGLAERSTRDRSPDAARQWIGRARLMNVDREEIAQKEADLGLAGQ